MKERVSSLLRTIEHLGEDGDTADVDMIRLAWILSSEIGDPLVPQLVALLRHTNTDARRVVLRALRRAGWWSNQEIVRAVVTCLSDPVAAVRLNAVHALEASGARTPLVIDGLRRLADDAAAVDTLDFDDDAQQARVQAAKAVLKIAERGKSS
jgi:HEAT repeat protein